MKSLLIATLIALAPVLATAETANPTPKKVVQTSTRASANPATKSGVAKSTKATATSKRSAGSTKTRSKKATSLNDASDRDELRSMAGQVAAGTRAADRALTPAELELADRVYTGRMPCELGNVVSLTPDPKAPGHFELELQKLHFRMSPVETKTGAIRLEDEQSGVVWLQLANKSMLMNQKVGQRLADECQNPSQLQVADSMKRTPAQSLFDEPTSAATTTPAEVPAASVAPATSARRPKTR